MFGFRILIAPRKLLKYVPLRATVLRCSMCVCIMCLFVELHITAQSGPVIYSSLLLLVTHLGFTYRKHVVG